MRTKKKGVVTVFVVSSLLTIGVVLPRISGALVTIPAHSCKPRGTTWPAGGYQSTGYVVAAGRTNQLICPIADEDVEAKWDASSVSVGVYDSSNGSQCSAQPCANAWWGSSVFCGEIVSTGTSFVGFQQLTITHANLSNTWDQNQRYWDFGWVNVTLNTTAGSKLIGLKVND